MTLAMLVRCSDPLTVLYDGFHLRGAHQVVERPAHAALGEVVAELAAGDIALKWREEPQSA
jgi:hypothetical protein